MLDAYRKEQNVRIEEIVKEVSDAINFAKSVRDFSEKLSGDPGLLSRVHEYQPVGVYQNILKDRMLQAIQEKARDLQQQESAENKSYAPKISQD